MSAMRSASRSTVRYSSVAEEERQPRTRFRIPIPFDSSSGFKFKQKRNQILVKKKSNTITHLYLKFELFSQSRAGRLIDLYIFHFKLTFKFEV